MMPTGGQSIAGEYTPGVLGTSGPVKISLSNQKASLYPLAINVTRDPGYSDIAYNQDLNSGTPLGMGV